MCIRDRLLPCICKNCKDKVDNIHYFEYRDVVESLKEGDETLKCKDSRIRVKLRQLLAYFFEDGDKEPAYIEEFRREIERNRRMHEFGYELHDKTFNRLGILERLIQTLPQTFRQDLALIQQNFEQVNFPETKMEIWLNEIKEAANLLPSGNEWKEQFEEVYKHHYADIETKGKLEFVIPLIPGFLSYKGEIGGGFKTKIKDIWEDIKRPFVKDDKD